MNGMKEANPVGEFSPKPSVQDLVSTILPVYNRPALLRDAVESVWAQTYRPIEIIIVDDGSTDDTAAEAERLRQAHPDSIRVLHQENRGPGAAREAGRRVAAGEFIQYLDSDDLLMPRKFELQVKALRDHPECGISYGRTAHKNSLACADQSSWRRTDRELSHMFPAFAAVSWWGTGAPFYRREVVDRAGPWLGLMNCEDWEYDCRIAALGTRLAYVPEEVWVEHHHRESRLSDGGAVDPVKLKHRAIAHGHIARHIVAAGLTDAAVEVQQFAQLTFLLSRQCGAANLAEESRAMLEVVRQLGRNTVAATAKFRLYEQAARWVGYTRVARWSDARDKTRRRMQGSRS